MEVHVARQPGRGRRGRAWGRGLRVLRGDFPRDSREDADKQGQAKPGSVALKTQVLSHQKRLMRLSMAAKVKGAVRMRRRREACWRRDGGCRAGQNRTRNAPRTARDGARGASPAAGGPVFKASGRNASPSTPRVWLPGPSHSVRSRLDHGLPVRPRIPHRGPWTTPVHHAGASSPGSVVMNSGSRVFRWPTTPKLTQFRSSPRRTRAAMLHGALRLVIGGPSASGHVRHVTWTSSSTGHRRSGVRLRAGRSGISASRFRRARFGRFGRRGRRLSRRRHRRHGEQQPRREGAWQRAPMTVRVACDQPTPGHVWSDVKRRRLAGR